MAGLTLHPMKEVRIIVEGDNRPFVTDLLDKVNATGYTIFGNVSGKGHHGFHEAHYMFNDTESLVMILTVVRDVRVGRGGQSPGAFCLAPAPAGKSMTSAPSGPASTARHVRPYHNACISACPALTV